MKRNAQSLNPCEEDEFEHPVLSALPQEVKLSVQKLSRLVFLDHNEPPPKGHLLFLTSGALGVFSKGCTVCSGLIVPGSVYGWEILLDGCKWRESRAVIPTKGFSVPVEPLKRALTDSWMLRFLANHAMARTRDAAAEASCNALHSASQRTAKWLMRLHRTVADSRGISITQAQLGELLGFQRTSINSSCGYLKDRGAIEVHRGRIVVKDAQKLSTICCPCDSEDPVIETSSPLMDASVSGLRLTATAA
jgi:CRP-like cAMP-binding protein